jgi:hypothetical protein
LKGLPTKYQIRAELTAQRRNDMRTSIPKYCGSVEFDRSLTECQKKIGEVLSSFNHGTFVARDLNELAIMARRVAFVCQELMDWRTLKVIVEDEASKDELDCFCWE